MWRDNQRMERDLAVLLSEKPMESNVGPRLHNRRPYRDPNAQPVKWMKLPVVAGASGSDRYDHHAPGRGRCVHAV
jgi:hypothetical protein